LIVQEDEIVGIFWDEVDRVGCRLCVRFDHRDLNFTSTAGYRPDLWVEDSLFFAPLKASKASKEERYAVISEIAAGGPWVDDGFG
jgi:hypothetical protein